MKRYLRISILIIAALIYFGVAILYSRFLMNAGTGFWDTMGYAAIWPYNAFLSLLR